MKNIKTILLKEIANVYSVSFEEIEYAFNKLNSIDMLLEAVDYSFKNNLKLSVYAHELREGRTKNKGQNDYYLR